MASDTVFSVLISLIFIRLILAADLRNITMNEMSNLQTMSIDEYIDYVNPPAVHKFQNGNGDSILCVKYEDQISLRSGAINKGLRQRSRDSFTYNSSSVKECPEGSVPILEIKPERVNRAGSVSHFLNGRSRQHPKRKIREHARVDERAKEIWQSKAVFNVWQPIVQSDDSYSQCQMVLLHERRGYQIREAMIAGLQVDPKHYGDGRVRFFIYYTVDGYEAGCYNVECHGFVQEGKRFYPGMVIDKVSIYEGQQRESTISIRRETRDNNVLWAVYLQDILVGHWPALLFKDLIKSANRVDFGGKVFVAYDDPGTPHSKTDMGSGRFSEGGYKKAAYIRNIQLFTAKDALITKRRRKYVATNPKCYDVKGHVSNDDQWGDFIFYGGPGGDVSQCTNVRP